MGRGRRGSWLIGWWGILRAGEGREGGVMGRSVDTRCEDVLATLRDAGSVGYGIEKACTVEYMFFPRIYIA